MSRHSILQPAYNHSTSILVRSILTTKCVLIAILTRIFRTQYDMGTKTGIATDVPIEVHVRVRFLLPPPIDPDCLLNSCLL